MIARHDLALALLVDVQLQNGSVFHWATVGGAYSVVLGDPGYYAPWVKSVGPFRFTRSLRADAGDLLLQNLSGNTIDRDVGRAFRNGEFEGALVVVRAWELRERLSRWEFHGTLTEGYANEIEAGGRLLQLVDLNQVTAMRTYSELCTWRYQSRQCGSAGTAAICSKTLLDCLDPSRNAIERFGGFPTPPPTDVVQILQAPGPPPGVWSWGGASPTHPIAQINTINIGQAQLGIPIPLAYGYVRARGNLLLLNPYQDLPPAWDPDKAYVIGDIVGYQGSAWKAAYASTGEVPGNNWVWVRMNPTDEGATVGMQLAFIMLGEGEWDGIENFWLGGGYLAPGDPSLHFHPGLDGVLGTGISPVSNGGDQGVDAFSDKLPFGVQRLPYSRMAYVAIKAAPDPNAPTAQLDWEGDYRALKVRDFDATGTQTGYGFSTNGARQTLDALLRLRIKPEQTINEPLIAAEAARFDWPSFVDCRDWLDEVVNGNKRFESSCAFAQGATGTAIVEQLLLLSRIYLAERKGKILFYPDGVRFSVFTLVGAHVSDSALRLDKKSLAGASNQLIAHYNDLNLPVLAQIATAVRAAGVVTLTTQAPHGLKVKDNIAVLGVEDASFNGGPFQITGVDNPAELDRTGWTAAASSVYRGNTASRAIDASMATSWSSDGSALPQWIQIDMGTAQMVGALSYLPRQDYPVQRITQYEIYVSTDGINWTGPLTAGVWNDDYSRKTANWIEEGTPDGSGGIIPPVPPRYVRLKVLAVAHGYEGGSGSSSVSFVSAADIGLFPAPSALSYAQAGDDAASTGGTIGMNEQRYMVRSPVANHYQHQFAVGQRGVGLPAMPLQRAVDYDFGNNTSDRVARLLYFLNTRYLGLDTVPYSAPRELTFKAFMDAVDANGARLLDVVTGQMITIDRSVMEEMAGDYEVIEATHDFGTDTQGSEPSPTTELYLKEIVPEAYDDIVPDTGGVASVPAPPRG